MRFNPEQASIGYLGEKLALEGQKARKKAETPTIERVKRAVRTGIRAGVPAIVLLDVVACGGVVSTEGPISPSVTATDRQETPSPLTEFRRQITTVLEELEQNGIVIPEESVDILEGSDGEPLRIETRNEEGDIFKRYHVAGGRVALERSQSPLLEAPGRGDVVYFLAEVDEEGRLIGTRPLLSQFAEHIDENGDLVGFHLFWQPIVCSSEGCSLEEPIFVMENLFFPDGSFNPNHQDFFIYSGVWAPTYLASEELSATPSPLPVGGVGGGELFILPTPKPTEAPRPTSTPESTSTPEPTAIPIERDVIRPAYQEAYEGHGVRVRIITDESLFNFVGGRGIGIDSGKEGDLLAFLAELATEHEGEKFWLQQEGDPQILPEQREVNLRDIEIVFKYSGEEKKGFLRFSEGGGVSDPGWDLVRTEENGLRFTIYRPYSYLDDEDSVGNYGEYYAALDIFFLEFFLAEPEHQRNPSYDQDLIPWAQTEGPDRRLINPETKEGITTYKTP